MNRISGSDLIGTKYKPLFPYFDGRDNAFTVLHGDFVNISDGTGVVHMAPGFGEDDFNLCKDKAIEFVCPIDDAGCFTDEVYDLNYKLAGKLDVLSIIGKQVFDTNDDIIKYLKASGSWLKTDEYIHNYPHCWRTDTPLIYKAVSSWYVNVLSIRDRMIELNRQINWIPGSVRDGIFGKWLENTKDWSISRNRFWGCPIPIWRSNNPDYPRVDVYGSIKELERDFSDYYKQQYGCDLEVTDLHRPFIDSLTRPNPDDPTGKSMMVRIEDVLDCWFESGSMPFASVHYPFDYSVDNAVCRDAAENKKWFEDNSPADFIVEYVAQTRGWFYTLLVLSTALFDRIPFKNCICHGVVLDSKGQKLSKRLRNYPDPMEMFDKYGSDAMRFAMMRSGVMRGREVNIDLEGKFVQDVSRLVLSPIWNAFSFLKVYMEADGLSDISDKYSALFSFGSTNLMDRYIISELCSFLSSLKNALDGYDTSLACLLVENFIEIMNNWYIRRNRKRFWSSIKFDNANYNVIVDLLSRYKSLGNSELAKLASFSRERVVLSYEPGYNDYVESAVADAMLDADRPWRLQVNDNLKNAFVVDYDKQSAYNTLYSVLFTFVIAVAPLLPCVSEEIYLDLT